jgi:hypothetical protein
MSLDEIKDKAEDVIDGIKDRLDHEDHDCCIHPEHMIAEKAKDKVEGIAAKARKGVSSLSGKGSLLDRILGKVISRKLLVFGTATVLLAQYGLDPDTWGMIAIVYIGGQSVVDTMAVWRHGRR